MPNGLWLLLTIAAAYGCALASGWLICRQGRWAVPAVGGGVVAVLACPMLIGADRIMSRALAAFVSGDLMFRMVDTYRLGRRQRGPGFGDYARFLVPFPVLLVVWADHHRRRPALRSWWPEIAWIAGGAIGVAVGFLVTLGVSTSATLAACFPLDHVAKVLLFVLTIESASRLLYGLERLAGYDTVPFAQNVWASRTVADFWRRYNHRVHHWFMVNVFRPGGGRRAPVRGIVIVFLVSGLFHELMFGIATSCFDGYQLTFFLLQVPAVLLSGRMERLACRGGIAGRAVAHGFTILWMVVTSVFFFRGVARVFPFVYASEPWLP